MKDDLVPCLVVFILTPISFVVFWEPILLVLGGLCVLSFLCKHRVWILCRLRCLWDNIRTRKSGSR